MRKWAIWGLIISILLIVILGALGLALWLINVSELFILVAALSLVAQYVLLLILAQMLTSPMTKASWQADEEGRLLVLLVRDDKTLKATVGRRIGGNLLEFEVDGIKTIYVIHPESVLAHPGSKAHYTIAYAKSAVTLPPDALRIGFDVRHVHGHSHAAFVLLLSKTEKSLGEAITELRRIIEEVREIRDMEAEGSLESKKQLDEKKKNLLEVLSNMGIQQDVDSIDWNLLLARLHEQLITLEAEARRSSPGLAIVYEIFDGIINRYPEKKFLVLEPLRTVTASEIQAVIPTLSPMWALEQIKERAEWLAILRMKSIMGLQPMKIPWGWIILGGIILLAVLVLIQSGGLNSLGQAIGSIIPGLTPPPAPTPTPTPTPLPEPVPTPTPTPLPPVPMPTPVPLPPAPTPPGG